VYWGFVGLNNAVVGQFVTRNSSGTPVDSSVAPTFRVYGPTGIMTGGTGSASFADPGAAGGAITGATDATPIVITSVGHGLSSGTQITIAGVLGNTAANGSWVVTVIDSNTFSLNTSVGNGSYVSGGTWHTSGLYDITITPLGGNGYIQGVTYFVLVTYVVASVEMSDLHSFTVV
jgi:hypothetical protein